MLVPTSKAVFPFLKLPRELRNSIYAYALEWPDYSRKFGDVRSWSSYEVRCRNVTPVFEAMVTPTVLLLNHQITSEALPILYAKSFILTSPPPSQENYPQNFINPVLLTEFISKSTIRRMRFVILHLDLGFCSKAMSRCANGWKSPIDALLGVWTEENRLESVRFEGGYEPPSKEFGWTFDHCMHHAVVTDLLRRVGVLLQLATKLSLIISRFKVISP
ncbi:hypothetical protein B0O99DRAFT_605399 [Bisporella sp. PMI_857]|nr:hypothetical protein B0O99DRAFT_605399 [Bisporella sp. PMI_857]